MKWLDELIYNKLKQGKKVEIVIIKGIKGEAGYPAVKIEGKLYPIAWEAFEEEFDELGDRIKAIKGKTYY